jgi:hypothetical protein
MALIVICFILICSLVPTIRGQEQYELTTLELVCPRGYYHDTQNNPKLLSLQECRPCPRGRYGDTIGLVSSACTATCPRGRYGEKLAAMTVDDCRLCPAGTVGTEIGLTTARCSKQCPVGKFSRAVGATSESACLVCDTGYKGQQCNFSKRGNPNQGVIDDDD